jgi:hypothetical protein
MIRKRVKPGKLGSGISDEAMFRSGKRGSFENHGKAILAFTHGSPNLRIGANARLDNNDDGAN